MLHELSNQLADAVAAASPSVVQVHGRRRPASGLVYADEVVLTTGRAIGREDGLHVRPHEGDPLPAELVGWDPATSLAVLRARSLRAAAIAPAAEDPRVGHLALAVARSWSNAVTASAGIVAVIGGPLPTGRHRRIDSVIRTTAPMHEGFAGGALLSARGGLIGVATAATIRGFGVVIPARLAWTTAATLLEHGSVKRGYLGVVGQPVTLADRHRTAGGRERALLVAGVSAGGPAARAGVLVGDVVAAVDDTTVESPEDLLDVLMARTSGQTVALRLWRGHEPIELAVTLGDRPELRRMRPSRMSRDATNRAVLLATAKQMPCAGRIMAVLMPMTSPRVSTSGPPELPGFSAASVWITSSMSRFESARSDRPSALTTPAVTE